MVSNSTYTILKANGQPRGSSREYDTAWWTFNSHPQGISNLAFLPIIAIIIIVLCFLVKAYQWSRKSARWKVERGVEFSEEIEDNYIINIGDKDFCPVDVHSDGASVYDTVTSVRFLENGYAIQLNETHPYHDTITSYKSLLMQRADLSQYDSVKSYKAFLQKVTQNKDLAVEVKLLENYPIHSKSTEHCVVLEEESSERSGETTTKMLGTLPLNKQLHKDGRFPQVDKKKLRHRRASGDVPSAMRKRSASNPSYRRVTNHIGSLPSIRQTVSLSSDSEEDSQQSFMMDRKKLRAERKKLSRSISGGKISKDTSSTVQSNGQNISGQKRVRHFSADGAHRLKKAAGSSNKSSSNFFNNQPDLKDTQKMRKRLTKSMTKTKNPVDEQAEESSSENPVSSNSSDSDCLSDAVVSDSDVDTKRNTLASTASDDQTLDNDVFFSLDSGAELVSSSEILHNSSKRPLSETKIQIARAKEEFFMNKVNHISIPLTVMVSDTSVPYNENNISNIMSKVTLTPTDNLQTLCYDSHSTSADVGTNLHLHHASEPSLGSKVECLSNINQNVISTGRQQSSEELKITILEHDTSEDIEGPKNMSSPHMVQRFHVTFVNNDIPSLSSE